MFDSLSGAVTVSTLNSRVIKLLARKLGLSVTDVLATFERYASLAEKMVRLSDYQMDAEPPAAGREANLADMRRFAGPEYAVPEGTSPVPRSPEEWDTLAAAYLAARIHVGLRPSGIFDAAPVEQVEQWLDAEIAKFAVQAARNREPESCGGGAITAEGEAVLLRLQPKFARLIRHRFELLNITGSLQEKVNRLITLLPPEARPRWEHADLSRPDVVTKLLHESSTYRSDQLLAESGFAEHGDPVRLEAWVDEQLAAAGLVNDAIDDEFSNRPQLIESLLNQEPGDRLHVFQIIEAMDTYSDRLTLTEISQITALLMVVSQAIDAGKRKLLDLGVTEFPLILAGLPVLQKLVALRESTATES